MSEEPEEGTRTSLGWEVCPGCGAVLPIVLEDGSKTVCYVCKGPERGIITTKITNEENPPKEDDSDDTTE